MTFFCLNRIFQGQKIIYIPLLASACWRKYRGEKKSSFKKVKFFYEGSMVCHLYIKVTVPLISRRSFTIVLTNHLHNSNSSSPSSSSLSSSNNNSFNHSSNFNNNSSNSHNSLLRSQRWRNNILWRGMFLKGLIFFSILARLKYPKFLLI